jgi:hypothetical protein
MVAMPLDSEALQVVLFWIVHGATYWGLYEMGT